MPTCSWVPIILSSMTHPLSSTVGILGTSAEDSAKNNLKGGWQDGWDKGACSQADNSSSCLGTQQKVRSHFLKSFDCRMYTVTCMCACTYMF